MKNLNVLPVRRFGVALLIAGLGVVPPAWARHSHINAGATSRQPGSPLNFSNGTTWDAASGFLIHLAPNNTTPYGPIYLGGTDVTFTSLAATPDNGGPDPRAALPGSHVEMILVSVTGPAAGALSFWDSFDGFFEATEITFSMPTATTNGAYPIALSENDGSAGADPYGHIHGRKFSANVPGLYTAGFRLVDTSVNGAGGGPVHSPSEVTYFNFQAGTTLQVVKVAGGEATVQFGTELGKTYYVEASNALGVDAHWTTLAGPLAGTDRLMSVGGLTLGEAVSFFRLRVE